MTTILFRIVRICLSQFKCNYLKNEKPSGNFPFNFCDPHQILNILKKNLIVHANVFPKLQTAKDLLDHYLRSAVLEHPLIIKILQAPKHLLNFHECMFIIFPSFCRELIWKISPLLLCEILPVLVNTLSAYDNYPIQDCENFPLLIQMQLSEKRKKFWQFFVPFLESKSNFKHFRKKDDRPS